jgi:SAM-dependent methyltransferase
MTLSEATELIRPAILGAGGAWVDFGAGAGLFTRALATLLEPPARVVAVDHDARALRRLHESIPQISATGVAIETVVGDFRDMDAIPVLTSARLDGALFANSLHFAPAADRVLGQAVQRLRDGGRIVVIEYDGRPANRWVPHPVPLARLAMLAAEASLQAPRVVGERPSAFGGVLFCAVLELESA